MTSFDTFVKEQVKKAKSNATLDVEGTIANYRQRVEEFYGLVCTDWLKKNIEAGEIIVERKPVTISEELLGSYQIDGMNVVIGDIVVRLRPVGTILIGTRGRIDICYHSRRSMFVLIGQNINSPRSRQQDPGNEVWKYVDRSGMMNYVSLNADYFQRIILDLING